MTTRALACILAANFFGGSSYWATGLALRGLSPTGLAFWRLAIGSACFLPFAVTGLRRSWPDRRSWLGLFGVGWLGLAAPLLVGNIGQRMAGAADASLFVAAEPLSVVLLSALFLGEAMTGGKALAVGLGILGSSLIVLQGPPWTASFSPHWRGDLVLAFHGFLWSLYTVIGKPVLRKVDPMTFGAVTTLLALPPVALFAWREGVSVPSSGFGPLLYLAVGVTVLGVITWNEALEKVPASTVANFIFLQPLIGVGLAVALLGESFTRWSALGGASILAGVYLAARPAAAVSPTPPDPARTRAAAG